MISTKINNCVKEIYIFKNNKFLICSSTNEKKGGANENKEMNISSKEKETSGANFFNSQNNTSTTCLRFFPDLQNKYEFIDTPSHYGETTRMRVNYDENLIFSSGSDGCVNMYSIDFSTDGGDDGDRYYFDKISDNFTNTVLIKKSKLKEKEIEKLDAPEKREELLKNGYRTFKKKDERQIELDNLIRELERDIEDE